MSARVPRPLVALILAGALLAGCSPADAPTAPRLAPGGVHANVVADMVVTSTGDDGATPGTLRHAILNAPDPGVIAIDASLAGQTITLVNGDLAFASNLTILGPGAAGVTIDGNGSRVFSVYGGSLTLKDMTITGGSATGSGGGIVAHVALSLERVTMTGNSAGIRGGAISASGPLSILNSVISNNSAVEGGGGVYGSTTTSAITILESTLSGNDGGPSSSGDGGGLHVKGTATITRSTISGNSGGGSGGGIYVASTGSLTLANSTVSGNDAALDGGGIHSQDGVLTLVHATVTANTADFGGGVSWDGLSTVTTFDRSIVRGNTANVADDCNVEGQPTLVAVSVIGSSCAVPGPNVIIADARLGPLADNGGPTWTHALLKDSPALESNASCAASVDQRGVARPQGPKCDAGAYEFDAFVTPALAIDPAGTTNQTTGVATVGGTTTCSQAATVTLRATVTQKQKNRKVPTTVTGSQDFTVDCAATKAWAVAVTPATGSFNNSPADVKVEVVSAPAWVLGASVTRTGVVMAWTRR